MASYFFLAFFAYFFLRFRFFFFSRIYWSLESDKLSPVIGTWPYLFYSYAWYILRSLFSMMKLNTYSKWCHDLIKDGFKAFIKVYSASSESSISIQQSGPWRGKITSFRPDEVVLGTLLSRNLLPPNVYSPFGPWFLIYSQISISLQLLKSAVVFKYSSFTVSACPLILLSTAASAFLF